MLQRYKTCLSSRNLPAETHRTVRESASPRRDGGALLGSAWQFERRSATDGYLYSERARQDLPVDCLSWQKSASCSRDPRGSRCRLRPEDCNAAVCARIASQAGFRRVVFAGRTEARHSLARRIECQVSPLLLHGVPLLMINAPSEYGKLGRACLASSLLLGRLLKDTARPRTKRTRR